MASTQKIGKFYVDIDLGHSALLLADIQEDIASRLPQDELATVTTNVLELLNLFRGEIKQRRRLQASSKPKSGYEEIPLIVHHVFPAGINSNSFISPYNKLAGWFKKLEAAGYFDDGAKDPNHPRYTILEQLHPENGIWGSKDEIIIPKLSAGCFSSSELLGYFRARGIRHVILCGLTTAGAILGSARLGADLDFHIVVPREGVMDDDKEVNDFLLNKVLPRFVDVVDMVDVKSLFDSEVRKP